jgi:hypothetical protein
MPPFYDKARPHALPKPDPKDSNGDPQDKRRRRPTASKEKEALIILEVVEPDKNPGA